MEKINYLDIPEVNENTINRFFYQKPSGITLFDLELIMKNGTNAAITIEYGIAFRPVVYFPAITYQAGVILVLSI